MIPIASHMTAFLTQRLSVERNASRHTCDTYAYAFQLLLEFASRKLKTTPSALHLEQLDAPMILRFLDHLQKERGNSSSSRNARLTAIKSFMRFVEYRVPSALEQVLRIRAIPAQKSDTRLVRHLTAAEYQPILDAPDPATRLGIRDRAMLHMAVAGGLRVSELVGLRRDDLRFDGRYVEVQVRGKGRKERALTLWKVVADSQRAWLAIRGDGHAPELFLNSRGHAMTRSGFESVLAKHVEVAARACPLLLKKRVSPHVLRHTCAVNILRATGDIRKVALWLGHASIETAEIYVHADPTDRLETLAAVVPPMLRPGKFRPPDRLIAMLRGA